MALCESIAGCDRVATNAVPMFMGSVWLCSRCSVEFEVSIPAVELRPRISAEEWERIDREVWGLL